MYVRPATYKDIGRLQQIFTAAKTIMRDSGNLHQWDGPYPSKEIIEKDIDAGYCHVLCKEGEIIGTMALIPGPDPTYTDIEGEWPDDEPYFVIHRIATDSLGRHVARRLFDWAFKHIAGSGCNTIRIDTHRDNCIMKHILSSYGFKECGVIHLADGAPRDAYHGSIKTEHDKHLP